MRQRKRESKGERERKRETKRGREKREKRRDTDAVPTDLDCKGG